MFTPLAHIPAPRIPLPDPLPNVHVLCLLIGHKPEYPDGREAKGHVDCIEQVETATGPGHVPVRTIAYIAHCGRRGCTARRVEVDLAPMQRVDRRMTKWVSYA